MNWEVVAAVRAVAMWSLAAASAALFILGLTADRVWWSASLFAFLAAVWNGAEYMHAARRAGQ